MIEGPNLYNMVSIGIFNARSMCNKTVSVIEMFCEHNLDICFVTESGLKKNDKAKYAEFHEHNLDIINTPRKGKGGGVGFIFNPKRVKLPLNPESIFPKLQMTPLRAQLVLNHN